MLLMRSAGRTAGIDKSGYYTRLGERDAARKKPESKEESKTLARAASWPGLKPVSERIA
jgi:hypothetical protein